MGMLLKSDVDFIQSLSTEALEHYWEIEQGKSQRAVQKRLYCALELVDRYTTGRKQTALVQRSADKYLHEAKILIGSASKQLPVPPTTLFDVETLGREGQTTKFFSTDIFYTLAAYFTRARLAFHRGNKVLLNFT